MTIIFVSILHYTEDKVLRTIFFYIVLSHFDALLLFFSSCYFNWSTQLAALWRIEAVLHGVYFFRHYLPRRSYDFSSTGSSSYTLNMTTCSWYVGKILNHSITKLAAPIMGILSLFISDNWPRIYPVAKNRACSSRLLFSKRLRCDLMHPN